MAHHPGSGGSDVKVVIVTGHFGGPEREPWLLDDLAKALVAAGHTVDVIVCDATHSRPSGVDLINPGFRILSVGTSRPRSRPLAKLAGYVVLGARLHTSAFTWTRGQSYDLCIFTSIASFTWGLPRRLRRRGRARLGVLFLWDFFPIHQLEIGRIRLRVLAPLMKSIERWAIGGADVVALMSPANTRFFRDYHAGLTVRTIEVAPWSSSGSVAAAPTKRDDMLVAIFGGQLAKGRGLVTLLDCATLLQASNSSIEIVIAGDGPDRDTLEGLARDRSLGNVRFLGSLVRDEYRAIAVNAHVGIAITVPGVTPPSFPSKIIEYCGLGLPVLVCVEASSDAGAIIEQANAGIAVLAGDPEAMADALRTMASALHTGELAEMSRSAKTFYESEFRTERVVAKLEALLE